MKARKTKIDSMTIVELSNAVHYLVDQNTKLQADIDKLQGAMTFLENLQNITAKRLNTHIENFMAHSEGVPLR